MAAFQQLAPASFRGVPFLCPEGTKDGGRHAIKHDYPDSSLRFVEDNGLCVPDFKIHCVVSGADALSRLRRLEAALNTPGPGTLAHPIHGRQFVQVGKYHVKHDDKDVGVYTVEAEFHVTGPASFPGAITGIAAAITGLSASAIGAMFSAFQAGLSVFSVAALSQTSLTTLTGAVSSLTSTIVAEFGDVAQVSVAARLLATQGVPLFAASFAPSAAISPATLSYGFTSATPQGLSGGLAPVLFPLVRGPFDEPMVGQDRLWTGFLALVDTADAVAVQAATFAPVTADLAVRGAILTLLATTTKTVALLSLCEAAAGKVYATADQVSGDIATISGLHLDVADALAGASISQSGIKSQVTRVVVETISVLQKEQITLPDVRELSVISLPASVLTYMLYDQEDFLNNIVGLNAGRNPILYNGPVNVLRNAAN